MTSYFTADLHLGHTNIIELANRPFGSVDEMNDEIVRRWNETVLSDDDVVWILGDVCMGQLVDTIEIVQELRGRKILIPGNHDRVSPLYPEQRSRKREMWAAMYRRVFWDIVPGPVVMQLQPSINVKLDHFPYDPDPRGRLVLDAYRPTDEGHILLHGHVHNEWQVRDRQINVGVDVWNFYPVSYYTVLDMAMSL